jgi:hypothetical protein
MAKARLRTRPGNQPGTPHFFLQVLRVGAGNPVFSTLPVGPHTQARLYPYFGFSKGSEPRVVMIRQGGNKSKSSYCLQTEPFGGEHTREEYVEAFCVL